MAQPKPISDDLDQATKDFMRQLQREFLDEAMFLVDQGEELFLNIESSVKREEDLAKIFRIAHTLKGSGAAVALFDLSKFAHKMEDCLAAVRVNPGLLTRDLVSLMLECCDAIRKNIELYKGSGLDKWSEDDLSSRLDSFISNLNAKINSISSQELLSETAVDQVKDSGKLLQKAHQKGINQQLHGASVNNSADDVPHQNSERDVSVKIDSKRIDAVLEVVGELVVMKNLLLSEAERFGGENRISTIASQIDKTIRNLQDRALSMRVQSLKPVFQKLQRIVRDTSSQVHKPIRFCTSGENTEIDRSMVEQLIDPLMHMVRNAIDHGVEAPIVRQSKGKSGEGTISLHAKQSGSRVILVLEDDGNGLDRTKIIAKAIKNGLLNPTVASESLSDNEVFNLIFAPGFSTADRVTEISGRGVGMDVVKTNIAKLKGTIEIESTLGLGTKFIISLPITTSITEGMMVGLGSELYIVPMDSIKDLVELDHQMLTNVSENTTMVEVRGKHIKIVDLKSVVSFSPSDRDGGLPAQYGSILRKEHVQRTGMIIVVEQEYKTIGIMVDQILGQIQVVLKPIGIQGVDLVSGAAIVRDGKVAMVLNLDHLFQIAQ